MFCVQIKQFAAATETSAAKLTTALFFFEREREREREISNRRACSKAFNVDSFEIEGNHEQIKDEKTLTKKLQCFNLQTAKYVYLPF